MSSVSKTESDVSLSSQEVSTIEDIIEHLVKDKTWLIRAFSYNSLGESVFQQLKDKTINAILPIYDFSATVKPMGVA